MVDYINRTRKGHILTLEDPVEFVHESKGCLVNQRDIGSHTESFHRALKAALREDPDVVLVGEMRDLETIALALEIANTGHLVLGTLHTSTAISTVDRIIDQFPPEQQNQVRTALGESLKGVLSQNLCKKVGGGRVAAVEVMVVNAAVANQIRQGKTHQIANILQTSRGLGNQLMLDELQRLVATGKISAAEAVRCSPDPGDTARRLGLPEPE
jgi:twitching motility protein PilT